MSDKRTVEAVTDEERARVKALCDAHGPVDAAEQLGIGKESLLRVIAGQQVHRGTVVLLRLGLAKLEGVPVPPPPPARGT